MIHDTPQTSPTDLLSTKEAAQYLNVSPLTLVDWRYRHRFRIPFCRVGAAIRYRRADLDAFLAARTVGAVAPAPSTSAELVGV